MERRTALATAVAAGLSVLAVGAALGANLRTEPADLSEPVASVAEGTPTTLEPTVVTVIVPAPEAPAVAPSQPAAARAASTTAPPSAADDHGGDHDDWDDDDYDDRDDDRDDDDDDDRDDDDD